LEDSLKIGGLQPSELIDIIDKRASIFSYPGSGTAAARLPEASSAVIDAVRATIAAQILEPSRGTGPSAVAAIAFLIQWRQTAGFSGSLF